MVVMRRLLVLTLLIVTSSAGVAQSSSPARLAGVTTITGVGAVAVPLQAAAFTLRPGSAGVTLATTGKAAALVLARVGGAHAFQNLAVDVLGAKPNGCADNGVCGSREGFVGSFREGMTSAAPWSDAHFAGGRYVAYLITEPGKRVTATIRAQGLSGTSAIRATTRVRAQLTRQRVSDAIRAQTDGSASFRTFGPTGIFQFLWTADAGTLPVYNHQMQLCLDRAGEGATPAPDQACMADGSVRPPLLGGTSQGTGGCYSQAVAQGPGKTEPGYCSSLHPLLPRDTYVSRWSAARTGQDPAVGYLGIALEYERF
jgi:hypothetical protein